MQAYVWGQVKSSQLSPQVGWIELEDGSQCSLVCFPAAHASSNCLCFLYCTGRRDLRVITSIPDLTLMGKRFSKPSHCFEDLSHVSVLQLSSGTGIYS